MSRVFDSDYVYAMDSLRRAMRDKIVDKFKIGDVIRWVAAGKYNYAAIKTPVGWYTTSKNMRVPNMCRFDELVEVLKADDVTDIEVASDWEGIFYHE